MPSVRATQAGVAAVREVLDRTLDDGARALLGLSGGPDSAALLRLVVAARADLALTAVHVRHGVRDDAADAEIAAAQAAAARVPLQQHRVAGSDSGQLGIAAVKGRGPEDSLRRLRYAAFADAAAVAGANVVLLGHTRDDQAETVLLRLARGAGARGLSGMAPVGRVGALVVVRPLLRLARTAVRAVVADQPTADDPTNADLAQPRAAARALLPALDTLAGERRDAAALLARAADRLREDADALDALAAALAARHLCREAGAVALPSAVLAAQPRAIALRLVRLLIAEARGLAGGRVPDLASPVAAAVLALPDGGSVDVTGGIRVRAVGDRLLASRV